MQNVRWIRQIMGALLLCLFYDKPDKVILESRLPCGTGLGPARKGALTCFPERSSSDLSLTWMLCLILTVNSGSQPFRINPSSHDLKHTSSGKTKAGSIYTQPRKVLLWYFTLDFYQNSTRYYRCTSASEL